MALIVILLIGALLATLLSDVLKCLKVSILLPSLALLFLSYILYLISFALPLQISFLSSFAWFLLSLPQLSC